MKPFGKMIRVALLFALVLPAFGQTTTSRWRETDLANILDPLFSNQPDYMADVSLVINGNVVTNYRFASKRGLNRWDIYPLRTADPAQPKELADYKVTVISTGKTFMAVDPQTRMLAALSETSGLRPTSARDLAAKSIKGGDHARVVVQTLEDEKVNGREVYTIRVTSKSDPSSGEMDIYVAKDANLVLKIDVAGLNRTAVLKAESLTYTLTNISSDVPDDLFLAPAGFEAVRLDRFMDAVKRTSAK